MKDTTTHGKGGSSMKVRVKVKDVSELKHGDEFLVGDQRWEYAGVNGKLHILPALLEANVPVERELEAPEGYEISQGDGEWTIPHGTKFWDGCDGAWVDLCGGIGCYSGQGTIYAVPVEPPAFEIPEVQTFPPDPDCWVSIRNRDWARVVAELKKHGAR